MASKENINDMNDIFVVMLEGCELNTKDIASLTIANLLKICGMVQEYLRLEGIADKDLSKAEDENFLAKYQLCKKMMEDELKLIDNFVATLAIGEYARKYNEKLFELKKVEIVTSVMKDSNEAIAKLNQMLKEKLEDGKNNENIENDSKVEEAKEV